MCAKKKHQKKVINKDTGVIYDSLTEATLSMGGTSTGRIVEACKNNSKTAYGYHWEYI